MTVDVVRGLVLLMDHGIQYLSEHFVNQVRFWGIKPCFAFVEQPQTQRGCGAVQPNAQRAGYLRQSLLEH
jgi:hypothetical protein